MSHIIYARFVERWKLFCATITRGTNVIQFYLFGLINFYFQPLILFHLRLFRVAVLFLLFLSKHLVSFCTLLLKCFDVA